MNFLELKIYEVGIYQNSVRHQHYYQLITGILESEIDKLGFCQSLRKMNQIFLELEQYKVGIYQDSYINMLVFKIDELDLNESPKEIIGFFVELETNEV